MARTITQIQTDIDTVRAEMGSPISRVRYGDREMQNRSTGDAEKALAALQAEMDTATALALNTVRPRQIRLSGSSGFGTSNSF